jgi:hypothetical protein
VRVPLRRQSGGEVETCSSLMHRVPDRGAAKSAAKGLFLTLHGVVFDILV